MLDRAARHWVKDPTGSGAQCRTAEEPVSYSRSARLVLFDLAPTSTTENGRNRSDGARPGLLERRKRGRADARTSPVWDDRTCDRHHCRSGEVRNVKRRGLLMAGQRRRHTVLTGTTERRDVPRDRRRCGRGRRRPRRGGSRSSRRASQQRMIVRLRLCVNRWSRSPRFSPAAGTAEHDRRNGTTGHHPRDHQTDQPPLCRAVPDPRYRCSARRSSSGTAGKTEFAPAGTESAAAAPGDRCRIGGGQLTVERPDRVGRIEHATDLGVVAHKRAGDATVAERCRADMAGFALQYGSADVGCCDDARTPAAYRRTEPHRRRVTHGCCTGCCLDDGGGR